MSTRSTERSDHVHGVAGANAFDHPEEAALAEVRRALQGIEYGSVLIKIHQGEVVGIETSTKVRLKSND